MHYHFGLGLLHILGGRPKRRKLQQASWQALVIPTHGLYRVMGLCWGDFGIMENETETTITGYIGIIQLSAEYATTAMTMFACSVQPAWVIEP